MCFGYEDSDEAKCVRKDACDTPLWVHGGGFCTWLASEDSQISDLDSMCNHPQYEWWGTDPKTARCVRKCGDTTYQSAPPTLDEDATCTELTTCAEGEYESVAPTATSDRVCAALTTSNIDEAANPAPPEGDLGRLGIPLGDVGRINWGPHTIERFDTARPKAATNSAPPEVATNPALPGPPPIPRRPRPPPIPRRPGPPQSHAAGGATNPTPPGRRRSRAARGESRAARAAMNPAPPEVATNPAPPESPQSRAARGRRRSRARPRLSGLRRQEGRKHHQHGPLPSADGAVRRTSAVSGAS